MHKYILYQCDYGKLPLNQVELTPTSTSTSPSPSSFVINVTKLMNETTNGIADYCEVNKTCCTCAYSSRNRDVCKSSKRIHTKTHIRMVALAVIAFIFHSRRAVCISLPHHHHSVFYQLVILFHSFCALYCSSFRKFLCTTAMSLQSASMQHQVLFVNWKENSSQNALSFSISILFLALSQYLFSFEMKRSKTYGKLFGAL